MKNGDFPMKNGDFPKKNGDFQSQSVKFPAGIANSIIFSYCIVMYPMILSW
jgi:hypothetical protein